MTPQELKISILQRALQGKLVEQDSFEGYGCAEIEKMTQHKKRLLKSKEIKREKDLPIISDEEKPTAGTAMQGLQAQGVRTVMLTGDAPSVAELVAKDLGIDEVHAGLLPADKVAWVEKLLAQKPEKKELAFVGDGINDAPVLMRADIGIAMGALGSDAAIEAADIVLMDDDPAKISLAMKISRKCMHIVYQNIVFALAVKAIFLLLGAFGIANMWWAVFADVGVMILAVLNAMRMLIVEKN